MMSNVVREGTGVGAALEGIEVAGKTGTAELNIEQRINQPWFIGFAPRSTARRSRSRSRSSASRARRARAAPSPRRSPSVVMQELLK